MKLFFDTETTGVIDYKKKFDLKVQPHIVQLGALLTNDMGETKAELNVLIKPNGWVIPPEAEAVHGISQADCEKYGIEIRSALGLFNMYLKMLPLVVAHNTSFDSDLVGFEVKRLGKEPILDSVATFCTMKASTNITKIPGPRGNKWPKLQELHKHLFGIEFEGAHDAMADVYACKRCYFELESKYPEVCKLKPSEADAL